MHFILEGPDGAGKTRLMEAITGPDHKFDYRHVGKKPAADRPVPYYLGMLLDRRPTIFDRFFLSEYVYSRILRKQASITSGQLSIISHALPELDTVHVLCLPPLDVCLANVAKPGRPRPAYQTDEFIAESWDYFDMLSRIPAAGPVRVYRYTLDPGAGFLKDYGVTPHAVRAAESDLHA